MYEMPMCYNRAPHPTYLLRQTETLKANKKHVARLMETLVQIEGRTTNVLMIRESQTEPIFAEPEFEP